MGVTFLSAIQPFKIRIRVRWLDDFLKSSLFLILLHLVELADDAAFESTLDTHNPEQFYSTLDLTSNIHLNI